MKEWGRWRLWILSLLLAGNFFIRSVECQSRGDEGDGPQSLGFDDVLRRHDGYVKGETPTIPQTSFSCSAQPYNPGLYADIETQCQVYHVCFEDRQESFLCGPGTNFNQRILACDFWYNFDCQDSPSFYNANADIGKVPNAIPGAREPGYPGRPEQPPSGGSYPPRVTIPPPPPQRPDIPRPPVQRPETPVFQPQPQPPRVPTPGQPPRIPPPSFPPPFRPQPQPQPPRETPPSFQPPPFRPQPQPDTPRVYPQPPPFRPQPDPPRVPVVPEYPSLPSGPGTGARQPYPPSVQEVDDGGYRFDERPVKLPPPPPPRPQTPRPQFPSVVSPPRVSRPPLTPAIIRQPEGSIPRPQRPITVNRPDYHPDANLKGNVPRPQQPRVPQPSTGYPSYPVPQRPISPQPIPQRPVSQRPVYVPPPSLQQEHIDYIPPPPPPQQPQRPPYVPPPQPSRPPYVPPPKPQRPSYVPPPQPSRPAYVPPPQQPQRPPYVPPPPPPQQPQRPPYVPPPPPPQQPQRPPYVPPPQQPSRPPYVPQPRPVQQEVTNVDFPKQPQRPYVPPIPQKPIDPDYGRPQPPVSPSNVRPVGRPSTGTGVSVGGQPPARPIFPPHSDHPNSNIKGGPGYNQPPPQVPRFEPTRIGRPSAPQPVPRPRPDQSLNSLRPVSDKRPSASVSGGVKIPQQERIKTPSEPTREIYQPPIPVVDHPRSEIKGADYRDPIIPQQPPQRIPSPSIPVSGVKIPQGTGGRKQPQRPRAPVVVSRPQPPSLPTTTVKKTSPADNQLYEKQRPQPQAPQPGRIKQPSQPQGQRTSQPRFPSHQPVDHPNSNVKGGDYNQPRPQARRPSGPPSSPSTSYEQRQTSGRDYPRGDPGISQQQVIQREYKPQRVPQGSRPSGVKTVIGQKTPSASQQNVISKQPRPEYDPGSSYTSGPDTYPKPQFGQPNSPYQPISTPSRSTQIVKQGSPSQNTIAQTQSKPNYQGSPATTGLGSQVRPDPSYNRVPGHQPANQPQVFPHRDNPDHPNESLKGSGAYRPPPPAGFQAAASEVDEHKVEPEAKAEPAPLLGDIGAE